VTACEPSNERPGDEKHNVTDDVPTRHRDGVPTVPRYVLKQNCTYDQTVTSPCTYDFVGTGSYVVSTPRVLTNLPACPHGVVLVGW